MSNCSVCNKPLNKSLYSSDGSLKSCPSCSTIDGNQHVFLNYPNDFGTTPLRASPVHPEGPQSHCVDCRSGNPVSHAHAIKCQNVQQ